MNPMAQMVDLTSMMPRVMPYSGDQIRVFFFFWKSFFLLIVSAPQGGMYQNPMVKSGSGDLSEI